MSMTLEDLPIGAKISFGRYKVEDEYLQDIVWIKADQNHEGYPENSVTLVTEKIIDLRAFDAREKDNSNYNIKCYGNNNYPLSNYRQWLNSDKTDWYKAQHNVDAPPNNENINRKTEYSTHPGFLYYFTEQEKNAILPTIIPVLDNEIVVTIRDLVFPLSRTEVGLENENGALEGRKLALFNGINSRVTYLTEQCFNNTKSTDKPTSLDVAWCWWLRTPLSGYSHYARYVKSSGIVGNSDAFRGSVGVRPALNLSANTLCYYDEKTKCFHINLMGENFYQHYHGDKYYLMDKAKLLLEIAKITNTDECREICCFEAMKMLIQQEDN